MKIRPSGCQGIPLPPPCQKLLSKTFAPTLSSVASEYPYPHPVSSCQQIPLPPTCQQLPANTFTPTPSAVASEYLYLHPCSVRLGKALIKYRGQNFFEYSFRNNIHGVPLRALVPCKYSNILSGTTFMACLYVPWSRAAYKQFSSLVERGKMRCENPQRPLGSYN